MTWPRARLRIVLSAAVFGALALELARHSTSQSVAPAPPIVKPARVNGVDLVYLEQGQGAPVLFVHGAFSDHRAWDGQREAVAQRYRYIAPTQRYFGTAPWPDDGERYSLAVHADDLAAFIREINVGPVHVVGWSYGGAIELMLAAHHPELVKSLLFFEPALATFIEDPADAKAAGDDRREMVGAAATASKAGDATAAVRFFVDGVAGQPGHFDALAPATRSMFLDNARTIPLLFAAPPPPLLTCAQLGRITAPVLIVMGELTRPFFKIAADTAHRCIPGSRLAVVPKGRHTAPATAPEAFNLVLLDFLRGS